MTVALPLIVTGAIVALLARKQRLDGTRTREPVLVGRAPPNARRARCLGPRHCPLLGISRTSGPWIYLTPIGWIGPGEVMTVLNDQPLLRVVQVEYGGRRGFVEPERIESLVSVESPTVPAAPAPVPYVAPTFYGPSRFTGASAFRGAMGR